jgi:hypothetical protein
MRDIGNDVRVPPFFWFRPVGKTPGASNKDVCFRAGLPPLAQKTAKLATDSAGSPVRLPLMETPSWKPPNGGYYHFGRFEAMAFLLRLYVHFMNTLVNPSRADNFNLGKLIKDNLDLTSLKGKRPVILLGDMTGHGGFAVPGHDTHSTGQQIDIHYIPEDGTNSKCVCGTLAGVKKWHLGLNAMLLHCIIEAGASSVVTDCEQLLKTAKLPKGQGIKPSTRHGGNPVHADHFHVDVLKPDPRASEFVKVLYANAEQGKLEAPRVFS